MWTGAGLLAGAIVLAAVTVAANWGGHEDGLLDETGRGWIVAAVAAGLVLAYGIRWHVRHPRTLDDEPGGRGYVFWLSLCSLGGGYLAFASFPADSFPATVEGAWRYDPSPAAAGMWLVVCSVALGCLFMLVSARPPNLLPLRRSLPFATAGVLTVVLVGGLVGAVVFPREPHTVAEGNGGPASVPESVSRVGWSWAPPMGTRIDEVRAGTHGPLVLLDDGAVSLDGTTGEELWSFRRPRDWGRDVWVDDEHVYVRYARGAEPEEGEPEATGEPVERTTVVLDVGTGEVTGEFTALVPEGEGALAAVTPEARINRSWTDGGGIVLTGRSLDGGGELWSHALVTPDEGQTCRHEDSLRYGGDLVTLYGCAPDGESRTGGRSAYGTFFDLFGGPETEVEVAVTAVDVTTGEESWRYEWTAEPDEWASGIVGRHSLTGDGSPVIALERRGGDPELLLLDAATGERLDHLPDFLFEDGGKVSRAYGGVVRIDTEGGVFHEDPRDGSLVHRVDASGGITATADTGDIRLDGVVDDVVALDDMVLVPHVDPYEQWVEVAVAPFGESVAWDSAQWIAPAGRVLVDMLAVPGAVAVHTGDDPEEALVEGLVP